MMTTQTRTKAASTPDAAMAAHPTAGQAQQHHAEWKYGGDNRVSWAPLRADLNDLVEAAWQQQLPSVSYQLLAGKEYQVRGEAREGDGGEEERKVCVRYQEHSCHHTTTHSPLSLHLGGLCKHATNQHHHKIQTRPSSLPRPLLPSSLPYLELGN